MKIQTITEAWSTPLDTIKIKVRILELEENLSTALIALKQIKAKSSGNHSFQHVACSGCCAAIASEALAKIGTK